MIEPVIETAGARLFCGVTSDQRRIERGDRRLDRRPLSLAASIFGNAGLEAAFVFVRPRIADILTAIGLGEKDAQADTPGHLRIRRVETLGAGDGGRQIENVLERRRRALRVAGRRFHDAEELEIRVDQRLGVGVEIGRRNAELVGPADPGRHRVGQILIRAHHGDAGEIKRLSRQMRQLLL